MKAHAAKFDIVAELLFERTGVLVGISCYFAAAVQKWYDKSRLLLILRLALGWKFLSFVARVGQRVA
jgi:hypothetical protein